jgi:uncharacterized membrane protein
LYPHRSLSRRGFALLMGCIALVSFAAGIGFLMIGAWPVFGFFGLDVVLIWWALKRNFRDGKARETITIDNHEVSLASRTLRLILSAAGPESSWKPTSNAT